MQVISRLHVVMNEGRGAGALVGYRGFPTSLNPGTGFSSGPTDTVARKQAFVKRAESSSRICSVGGGSNVPARRSPCYRVVMG